MAPEVFTRKYSFPCDIWSSGVCLYQLLSLKLPFDAKHDYQLVKVICEGKYEPINGDYSEDLKQIVYSMLEKVFFFYKKIIALKTVIFI
jgi:serine/threonine protein kinase